MYDIEIRGDDLYILTVSALYLIPEGRTRREGLVAKRLIWGVPMYHVHQCFHGMTWGPDGDLYFAMGDPLVSYGDYNRPDHWGHWTFFSRPATAAKEEGKSGFALLTTASAESSAVGPMAATCKSSPGDCATVAA